VEFLFKSCDEDFFGGAVQLGAGNNMRFTLDYCVKNGGKFLWKLFEKPMGQRCGPEAAGIG
jgi:hypothetical protein